MRCATKSALARSILLVGVLLVVASITEAQQPKKIWHVGLFHVGLDHVPASFETFPARLQALGYEQGNNIYLDWRNLPDEQAARESVKEFVKNRVDLIVAWENQTARAAKAATSTIPVVFISVTDPVAGGLVKKPRSSRWKPDWICRPKRGSRQTNRAI